MDLHPVLCRDRDSGAVCCCSGCWRERTAACPPQGHRDGDGGDRALQGGRGRRRLPGCHGHRARCRRCREPRALAPGGDGDEPSRPPCALLHRACKELQTIYMCVVSSAKGLNLYSFSAPSAPYELPNIQWKTTSVPKCVCV